MRLPFQQAMHIAWVGLLLLAACNTALPVPWEPASPGQSSRHSAPALPFTATFTPFQPLDLSADTARSTTPVPIQPGNTETGTPSSAQASPIPPTARQSAVFTPSTPEPATSTASPVSQPSLSASGIALWIDPSLPAGLRDSLALPGDLHLSEVADGAVLRLETGERRPVSRWIYALVAPFPTLEDGTSLEELQRRWREGGGLLWMDENTLSVFSKLWGAPGQGAVSVAPTAELVERAWDQGAWALVPFEALEPRWKVLAVDGLSPIHKNFDPATYPLAVPISLDGDPQQVGSFLVRYGPESAAPLLPATNRDPGRLTTLALTGVTALVRATAFTMEKEGILYPGRDIGDWLREADLTHISNEVPFAQNCPFPNPVQEDMRFCSDPGYIALLEDVGTDIVELTGDHFQDWGREAMLFTLDLYHERGWPIYGGGANLDQGRLAALVEHNGNRLAFIGCNGKGGGFAQAGPRHPGAVACGDGDWFVREIARLRSEGYLPIATFQHFEYYTYQAQPNQKKDFRRAAEAGAVIVSGSQAHQPQAMEFNRESFIHYGLGNLFFDQYDVSQATRQGFIDRYVFYAGRYISTELLSIQFVDYARPRPMTPAEREDLLRKVFRASGW